MKEKIISGKTYLGIELGSTRIKASLIDDTYTPVASGGYNWENKYENGYWTYSLDEVHKGIKSCYASLRADVKEKYGVELTCFASIGISGMMHGYLPFDADGNLLTAFRTWRNTTTQKASSELTQLFGFNVPQRWSISHLYQAILNGEAHIPDVNKITTLAGYIHYLLTGRHEVGIGEASGIFPISGNTYDEDMIAKFRLLTQNSPLKKDILSILPDVKTAGDTGAVLTPEGAAFLDETGNLKPGIPLCPPEGDAGTGMVATNSVKPGTGNISAGTSIFAMLVLEKNLSRLYEEVDIVCTPAGHPVAMVQCNNCCGEIDNWVNLFGEFASLSGNPLDKTSLYGLLYNEALKGDADCDGIVSFNYLSGEHITGVKTGVPMTLRNQSSKLTVANFIRSQLYSTMATLKIGMDIIENESAVTERIQAHGGLFKIKGVAQQLLANALNTAVSVTETASEGGAWGMALLAAYMIKGDGAPFGEWLEANVFAGMSSSTLLPDEDGVKGFAAYTERYKLYLDAQRSLGELI